MWPYTADEWNTLTYGIKRKVRRSKTIIWASIIPSITLVGLLIYTILQEKDMFGFNNSFKFPTYSEVKSFWTNIAEQQKKFVADWAEDVQKSFKKED